MKAHRREREGGKAGTLIAEHGLQVRNSLKFLGRTIQGNTRFVQSKTNLAEIVTWGCADFTRNFQLQLQGSSQLQQKFPLKTYR